MDHEHLEKYVTKEFLPSIYRQRVRAFREALNQIFPNEISWFDSVMSVHEVHDS